MENEKNDPLERWSLKEPTDLRVVHSLLAYLETVR